MPLPCMPDDNLQVGVSRTPAEFALRTVTGCIEYRRISSPARRRVPRDGAADDLAYRIDHRFHRMRRAGPDVVRPRWHLAFERLQRPDVGVRQIADVDVVTLAGTVRGGIVLAKHLQRRSAVGGA